MAVAPLKLYGLGFPAHTHPVQVEIFMCQKGGQWKKKDGSLAGLGMEFHFKRGISLIWPRWVWHKWSNLFVKEYLTHRTVAVLGPASSGKSACAAIFGLFEYYCFPTKLTGMYCSTTREMLEQRIWGEVKKFHREAKDRFAWLPGNLIESRQRIITDDRDEMEEGRDFRMGLLGVPCKRGESYVGLGDFVGVKNEMVRLFPDEASLLPRSFCDAVSNLDKNPDFKCVPLGNPKDTTDALGVMAEPAAHLGGWEGGIDQTPFTKTWETRRKDGIAIQFVGSDSPNLDGKLGIPIITQEAIDRDVSFYGTDSVWFTMMNQGMMPRGQGSRRVLTRQMCEKFGARNSAIWLNSDRTKGASLDAAYRGVGGDRCILKFWEFGEEINSDTEESSRLVTALTNQPMPDAHKRRIFSITESMNVPITNKVKDDPEDQIATFCMEQCIQRGVPPEHFFYEAGMRTELVQSFCRIWSNKTQSIDCGGTPTQRKVSYNIDVRCCDYYRKFITELWYSVRLLVEAGQFRGMTDEVMLEFCSREWGTVGSNLIEVEPKHEMKKKTGRSPDEADCCFPSGTMVLTVAGEMPIESVSVGEEIVTPFGNSKVESLHVIESDDVWVSEFSDGSILESTGNHKFFTWPEGWVRADCLSIDMVFESVHNLWKWKFLNSLFTKDESIAFKPLADIIKTTTGAVCRSDFYTELSGLSITESSRKICASITKMVTGQTTGSKTWSFFQTKTTPKNTFGSGLKIPSMLHALASGLKKHGSLPWLGTNLMLAGNGIPSTAEIFGREEIQSPELASFALRILKPCTEVLSNFARYDVRTNQAGLDRSPIKEIARFAKHLSLPLATTPRRIVLAAARPSPRRVLRKVYNLTLENHNAYYANGILVQNCAIAVEGARRLGFVIRRLKSISPAADPDDRWKVRLRDQHNSFWKSGQLTYA